MDPLAVVSHSPECSVQCSAHGSGRMEAQRWYLKTSKVALAIAVIRSKPPGRSSGEHVRLLAELVAGPDSLWRARVSALEAQVLQLRREVLSSGIRSGARRGNERLLPGTFPPKEPTASQRASARLEDSGCSTWGDPPAGPAALPRNPRAREDGGGAGPGLSADMRFFQHLLELKNRTEPDGPDADPGGSDASAVPEAAARLLDGLVAFGGDPGFPFPGVLVGATGALTRWVDDPELSAAVLRRCRPKLEDLKKILVRTILRDGSVNRFQRQHFIYQSVDLLGRCGGLRKSVVSLLFSEVNGFIEELKSVRQAQAFYDVTRYENTFWILTLLERLLEAGREESGGARPDPEDREIQTFLRQVDPVILQLSDDFTLFSVYVWRLSMLLKPPPVQAVENHSPL
ncbi:meiosis-specific protein MEI4 [Ornithorhynchus anatinus]|uniref:meiosis-specific protein MEI4 n=1 Tax=Ornithorhynchus anatinus TaxID=9258 RepID=UPI0019D43C0C|nr:meiosis-specific protein MEI4 [Ornithorhynchus anatinus]